MSEVIQSWRGWHVATLNLLAPEGMRQFWLKSWGVLVWDTVTTSLLLDFLGSDTSPHSIFSASSCGQWRDLKFGLYIFWHSNIIKDSVKWIVFSSKWENQLFSLFQFLHFLQPKFYLFYLNFLDILPQSKHCWFSFIQLLKRFWSFSTLETLTVNGIKTWWAGLLKQKSIDFCHSDSLKQWYWQLEEYTEEFSSQSWFCLHFNFGKYIIES